MAKTRKIKLFVAFQLNRSEDSEDVYNPLEQKVNSWLHNHTPKNPEITMQVTQVATGYVVAIMVSYEIEIPYKD